MPSGNAIRAGAAFIEIYTKDNALVRGLDRAQKRLKAFGTSVREFGTKLAGIGAAAVAPLAASAKLFADTGSDLVDMSQRTGASVEALSELGFAAEQSGADMATLETGLRKMQRTLAEAAGGSDSAQEALSDLGLSVSDLTGLSPDKQFKRFADRIALIQDPAQRATAAIKLFGKSGTQLLPLMSGGAAGIDDLQKQARKLGLTISTEDATAAEQFGDTLDVLWKVVKRGIFAVGAALEPVLSDLAQTIIRNLVTVANWIKQNKELIVTVFKIAAAVLSGGAALVALGAAISGLGTIFGAVSAVITGVGTAIGIVGTILAAILSPIGLVITGIVALGGYLLHTTGVGAQALDWLATRFEALKNEALAAFQGIGDALAAGDLALAGRILWLTLKLEWQKGVNFLLEQWTRFKEFFLRIGTEAFYGVVLVFNDAVAGLQIAWVETTSFLANAWTRFTGWLTKGWNSAVGFLEKTWVRFKGLFDDSVDVNAEVSRIDHEVAEQNAAAEQETQATLAGREQQRQARSKSIERDRAGAEQEIVREAMDTNARRQAQNKADIDASEKTLSDARKEWEDAIALAAKNRKQAEDDQRAPQPGEFKPPSMEDLLQGAGENVDKAAQRTVDVQGTFNAAAAQGLAAGGPSDRIAKATEDTAKGVNKLVRHADHGGLVFE